MSGLSCEGGLRSIRPQINGQLNNWTDTKKDKKNFEKLAYQLFQAIFYQLEDMEPID